MHAPNANMRPDINPQSGELKAANLEGSKLK